MTTASRVRSARVALVCVVAIASPSTPVVHPASAQSAAAPAAKSPPTQTTAAAPRAPAADPDGGWPRTYPIPGGGTATLYQPQIASWTGQTDMTAWSAVSYLPKGSSEAALGTIKLEAKTVVAPEQRLVSFRDFKIAESSFPTLPRDQARDLVAGLVKAIPEGDRIIALDRVLANIDTSTVTPKDTAGVKADPPRIFHSERPAILVNLDAEPIWSPIMGVDLKFAVNTNWDLFQVPSTGVLYLRNEGWWLKAQMLEGPWSPAGTLPQSFAKLPASENWKDVKANLPGRAISKEAMPHVFVSTTPAELILLKGQPAYQAVQGTSLLWVSNTDSDLFRAGQHGNFYYLVAGRWFSAPGLDGPWTFATPSLPEEFKSIPVEHPRARVLASVPGTSQAIEAVLLAQMPRTARVNIKQVQPPEVVYQGSPTFQKIEGTSLERAVNTDKDIIKVGDLYYMCFQAVWFMSKSPQGPWQVAKTVPKEIYTIPASSPVNHVTYVTVQEDKSDDEWVTFAYVAAYTGMMVAWGCAVWGSGWYYPPYYWGGGFYPVYYPYARTYGMSAWYNPWSGAYGRGYRAYGPYGGAGAGAVYNPRTGTYARGASAYGPYGGRAAAEAWNPRTGTYARTRQGSNVYGNWGSSYVQRGDSWARTAHVTNYATGRTTRAATGTSGSAVTSRGPGGTTVGRTSTGDIYAGRDGNVYRRSGSGSWQSWDNGSWNNTQTPQVDRARATQGSGTSSVNQNVTSQLNRDSAARAEGAQRTRDASQYRSSPSTSRASTYRSSGGGGGARTRGGGGRRR